MKPFYRFAGWMVRVIVRLFFGVHISGLEKYKFSGPTILASNHISLCDPPILGAFTTCELHFMAKAELFRNRLFAALIGALNAFPVRRGTIDRVALAKASQILRAGGKLLAFPEGTRQKSGILIKGHPGVAKLALDNQARVVPVCIAGANHLRRLLFSKRRIEILYGEPIETMNYEPELGEKERVRKLTEKIMTEISVLQKRLSADSGSL